MIHSASMLSSTAQVIPHP